MELLSNHHAVMHVSDVTHLDQIVYRIVFTYSLTAAVCNNNFTYPSSFPRTEFSQPLDNILRN